MSIPQFSLPICAIGHFHARFQSARILFLVIPLLLSTPLFQTAIPLQAEEERPAASTDSAAEQIKGKWVQYRKTAKGRFKTIKEHFGDHTILTVYDPQEKVVYSHRSDYEIDSTGRANVFIHRNRLILTGTNAGTKTAKESAYLFRIEGNKFYEVHGMLSDDRTAPSLKVWERE